MRVIGETHYVVTRVQSQKGRALSKRCIALRRIRLGLEMIARHWSIIAFR
jgi:hypothetical protein